VLGTDEGKAHAEVEVVAAADEVASVVEVSWLSAVEVAADSDDAVVDSAAVEVDSTAVVDVVSMLVDEVVSGVETSLALLALMAARTPESIQSVLETATEGLTFLKKAEMS
jgi:hypothetical protein